jgi:hypothetical protein
MYPIHIIGLKFENGTCYFFCPGIQCPLFVTAAFVYHINTYSSQYQEKKNMNCFNNKNIQIAHKYKDTTLNEELRVKNEEIGK